MTYREAWDVIYFRHCKEACDYAYMDNCQEEKCEYYMALQALNRQYYAECGSVWVKPTADRKTEQTEPQIYAVDPLCPTNKDKCFKCDDFFTCNGQCDEVENEPQTEVETMSCAECKHRPIGAEICEEACHYEPQTDWHYDEQDATWYPYKHEDEPQQKSCATCKHALGNWDGESNNCGRCCGADLRFYEPKDEPQTERSE